MSVYVVYMGRPASVPTTENLLFTYRLSLDDQLTTISLDDMGHGMWTHEVNGRIHDRQVLNIGVQETKRLEALLRDAYFDTLPTSRAQVAELEIVLDGDRRAMSLLEAPVSLRPFLQEMRALGGESAPAIKPTPLPTFNVFDSPPTPPTVANDTGPVDERVPVGYLWPLLGVPLIFFTQILTTFLTMFSLLYVLRQVPLGTLDLAGSFGQATGFFLVPLGIALLTKERRMDRAVRASYLYLLIDMLTDVVFLGGLSGGKVFLLVLAHAGARLGASWRPSVSSKTAPTLAMS